MRFIALCCMKHVLTNVGQVVKNLFPESISWSIVVQEAWRSTTVARMIGTRLGELRSRTIMDAG